MKKLFAGLLSVSLLFLGTMHVFALEVPTSAVVRNLDGVQEFIKTFAVSPSTDPESLIEAPFEYNGYLYTYTSIVKEEVPYVDVRTYTETVTVETEKDDLDQILSKLEPTITYDDGVYSGTLTLDHTSIRTQEAGSELHSYTLSDVREYDNLPSNDMSAIPQSVEKNGVSLPLKNVDWQVQSTTLVDDVLVPATYKAVATYSTGVSYSTPTGYISMVDYVGEVRSERISSITYTVTYTGAPIQPPVTPGPTPEPTVAITPAVFTPSPYYDPGQDDPAPGTAPEAKVPVESGGGVAGFLEDTVTMKWQWVLLAAGAMILCAVLIHVLSASRRKPRPKKRKAYAYDTYEEDDEDDEDDDEEDEE